MLLSKPVRESLNIYFMSKFGSFNSAVLFFPDTQTYGKSKFYSSSENLKEKTLKELFFDLECSLENRQICRDIFCTDADKEYGKLKL